MRRSVTAVALLFAFVAYFEPHSFYSSVSHLSHGLAHITAAGICLLCFCKGIIFATACASAQLLIELFSVFYGKPPTLGKYSTKFIVITGASSGIGYALALEASAHNATLLLGARRVERLETLRRECLQVGAKAVTVSHLDVTSKASINSFAQLAAQVGDGKVDVLVLNAGVPGAWARLDEHIDDKQLRDVMEVNYWGYVLTTQAFLPLLKMPSGSGRPPSHILVISSFYGKIIAPFQTGYCASKHAVQGFFDTLRQELRDDSVGVSIHCPGGVETEVQGKFQIADSTALLHFSAPDIFFASSQGCAKSILEAYDYGESEVLFPTYAHFMAYIRTLWPTSVDLGFHSLLKFYIHQGLITLESTDSKSNTKMKEGL